MARRRTSQPSTTAVALYSSDAAVRTQVRQSLGDVLSPELPPLQVSEFATPAALMAALDKTRFDCVVLDGESVPIGGMGLSYQIKDEVPNPPPTVVLVARQADAWLATWSRADGVVGVPVDPLALPNVVAGVVLAAQAGTLDDTAIVPGGASRHG